MNKNIKTIRLKKFMEIAGKNLDEGQIMDVTGIQGSLYTVRVTGLGGGGFSERELFELFDAYDENGKQIFAEEFIVEMNNLQPAFSLTAIKSESPEVDLDIPATEKKKRTLKDRIQSFMA